ncbi:spore protein [Desertibacillus haloalkaliphilus]|uniref:spore protein n=1 Tax=Desertibacillus haloalkaliphilus TaxID=1328930 RepID=UPI001C25AD2D|nr:spore protein [Desertibacillus haloalkaliphilus]MBU8907028.1 spore protein [Desertibacillus haloalkaliphilus]
MVMKNLLLVPGTEDFLNTYKEEIAHEFGMYRSVQEMDASSRDMTKQLLMQTEDEKEGKDS